MPRPRASLPVLLLALVAACGALEAAVLALRSDTLAWAGMLVAVLVACREAYRAARRVHGRLRRTWLLASAATTSWVVALALLGLEQVVRPGDHAVSIAEPVLLLSTVLAPIVLLSWPLSVNTSHRPGRTAFEVLLSALALVHCAWPFLVKGLVEEGGAYGTLGVVYVGLHVLTITAALAVLGGTRRMHRTSLLLAVAGVACFVVADLATILLHIAESAHADRMGAGVSVLGALLVALAAHHARDGELRPAAYRAIGTPLLMPWAPLAGAMAVGVWLRITGGQTEPFVRVTGSLIVVLAVAHLYVTARDNAALNRRLAHRAMHDPLTDLANRELLTERMGEALDELHDEPGHVALLLLDLDGFKTVNDTLGHNAGDALLRSVADRLLAAVRPCDTVARLGGDEFLLVLPALPGDPEIAQDAAFAVATRVRRELARGVDVNGRSMSVRASMGVALADGATVSIDQLIGDADLAMYSAKRAGRDRVALFELSMRETALERVQLERDLVLGLERGELRLAYQPIVSLSSGEIVAAEALVRWEHPSRGLLAPGVFLGVAEDVGLMPRLGEVVLAAALAEQRRWPLRADGSPCRVSVNLSAAELRDAALRGRVRAALALAGVAPAALILEITERLVIDDLRTAAAVLGELSEAGVTIAFDDFGSGHSGLSHLRDLPVDVVKLDRSFVAGMDTEQGRVLVAAVLQLSRGLGKITVAEGIEHADEAALLGHVGCDHGQGYHLARPLAPEVFRSLLAPAAGMPAA
ncbi:MAG TPA: bifunctional diguanylate cyclase/phosphodiesterase [Solirubrobacteraceae bacterium]|nr:bifunctional diguanylate cyclase/phosphodiesterase [Solirubrobacteraceae bacterium]